MTGQDDPYQDAARVLARYPLHGPGTPGRDSWPWLAATVERQAGPGEWLVTIDDPRLAELADGSPAPDGTPGDEQWYPQAFRDADELRPLPEGLPEWPDREIGQ